MSRLALAVAAAMFFCGCAAQQSVARTTSSPSAAGAASPSPASSPSPSPPRDAILVFVRPGAVSLVRPDGTVISSTSTTTLDRGEVAQAQFFTSDGALIGHYWDPVGNPTSPLAIALLDRAGTITPLAPSAAEVIREMGPWGSPIVVGPFVLLVQATIDKADYVRLDLATGETTVLFTAQALPYPDVSIPPGGDGPIPQAVKMVTMGTTPDRGTVRVMVLNVSVGGQAIPGPAYFQIDLRTLLVTGPYRLPVSPAAMSADGRLVGWMDGVLHLREVSSGKDSTILDVPYQNGGDHGGIRFSPDDAYVLVEGYGDGSMGFAVYEVATHRLIRSIPAAEPDEPLADVPLWWTDSHTIVFKTVDASGAASGHRFDIATGKITNYPAGLGAPVLMLG